MDPDASPPVAAPPGPAASRPASTRLRIARLAAEASLAVSGVVALQPGKVGLRMTAGAGQRVDGVVVTALPDGTYELSVHLVCALVPLPPLAERVRTAVLEVTAAAALGEAVGPVHVRVEEIADS